MKILLNGFELPREAEGDLTIGQVLSELKTEIQQGGKVVTSARMDNIQLAEGWKARSQLSTPVSRVGQLDITIQDPDQLRSNMLNDVASLVSNMRTHAGPLAVKFRIGDEVVANNELADLLENLKLVLNGLDLMTRSEATGMPPDFRAKVASMADRMIPTLDRVYKAQASGDYIAIADELQYELTGHLKDWQQLLKEPLGRSGVSRVAAESKIL